MRPARQGFKANDAAAAEIDQRLEERHNAVNQDGLAQIGLDGGALANLGVHSGAEQAHFAALALFGVVQRNIGALHQCGDIAGVVWKCGDAGGDADVDVESAQPDRRSKAFGDAGRRSHGGQLIVAIVGDDDGELVAAEPGHELSQTHAAPKPEGNLLQHLVASDMAVHIVNRLEAVQVHEEQGHGGASAFGARHGASKFGRQGAAVWKARQRIFASQRSRADLRRDAKGHLAGQFHPAPQGKNAECRRYDGAGKNDCVASRRRLMFENGEHPGAHVEAHNRQQTDSDREGGDERLALRARVAGEQALQPSAEGV